MILRLLQPLAFDYLEDQVARSVGLIRFAFTVEVVGVGRQFPKYKMFFVSLGRSSLPCIWLWAPIGQHVAGFCWRAPPFPSEPWIPIPAMSAAGPSSSLMCPSVSKSVVCLAFQ